MSETDHDQVKYVPDNLDRDKMCVEEVTPDYLWCLHCERAYKRGKFRLKGNLQICPYPGCDGDTVFDGWDWNEIRRGNTQYPEMPTEGERYPMYPDGAVK